MPALATATATRELRQLLEPFTHSASTSANALRIDRIDLDGVAMRSWPIEGGRFEQRSNGDMIAIQPMLQATRSFVATYGGERVQIDRNTRVAVGHEIARAHPDWFEPADDLISVGARSRSARPTRPPTRPKLQPARSVMVRPARAAIPPPPERPKYKVALRDTRSRASVTISEFAYEVIQKECLRMAPFHNLETGGLIAARTVRSWDTSVYVVDARGPGPRSKHMVNEFRIDLTGDVQLERDFASAENDIGEAGQWHTHPSGGATPSPPDLDTWADALRYTNKHRGSGLYVGLIATPGWRGSWRSPQLTAYVVRRGESEYHGYVCEPAAVNVQGQRAPTWIAP
jgi:Prokaryotic homologs of the JAB domain